MAGEVTNCQDRIKPLVGAQRHPRDNPKVEHDSSLTWRFAEDQASGIELATFGISPDATLRAECAAVLKPEIGGRRQGV